MSPMLISPSRPPIHELRGHELIELPRIRLGDAGEGEERPPGARIAPTAEDRETLLGKTRKAFSPGMMRSPYFSPKLDIFIDNVSNKLYR